MLAFCTAVNFNLEESWHVETDIKIKLDDSFCLLTKITNFFNLQNVIIFGGEKKGFNFVCLQYCLTEKNPSAL